MKNYFWLRDFHPLATLMLFSSMLLPVTALAAEAENSTSLGMLDTAYVFQVIGSLLLVFGGIFGLIFLLKKMNGVSVGHKSPIKVLGASRVGTREKILLVEAGDQQLLIGVTTGSIRTLHVFDTPIIDTAEASNTKPDFASLMGSAFSSEKAQ